MRPFHTVVPDHEFVFHIRKDVPPRKGEIGNDVSLAGSRAATVAVVIKNHHVFYGLSKCQWEYQFCRKLGRHVALGRAMHAMSLFPERQASWTDRGWADHLGYDADAKAVYSHARAVAINIISGVSYLARAQGFDLIDKQFSLDRNTSHA